MKLDERILRLIAVGASVSANCQPCLEVNVAQEFGSPARQPLPGTDRQFFQ